MEQQQQWRRREGGYISIMLGVENKLHSLHIKHPSPTLSQTHTIIYNWFHSKLLFSHKLIENEFPLAMPMPMLCGAVSSQGSLYRIPLDHLYPMLYDKTSAHNFRATHHIKAQFKYFFSFLFQPIASTPPPPLPIIFIVYVRGTYPSSLVSLWPSSNRNRH